MKLSGIQPWPWMVQYRQFDGRRHSKPRIIDDRGKPVKVKPRQAELMAASPILYERLAKLVDVATGLHYQINSALELNTPLPQAIIDAEEILRAIRLTDI